ncbi:MAG: metallophosphoesterase [Gemmatimonadales bacterium]|nr:metallophosphoesterase [Gemmatimonadales bacterium]MDZ4389506.1 metallophosphoesterase [Gemmatimonadales bacterium]
MTRNFCLAVLSFGALSCAGQGRMMQVAPAPESAIVGSLFLVGDAGAPVPDDPVLAALGRALGEVPERSSVVFLGDNIYPAGIPDPSDPGYPEAQRRLAAQVDAVVGSGAKIYFVPGNHDWARHAASGWQAVIRQTAMLDSLSGGRAALLPGNGCPGPVVRDVPGFRLVTLDSQWWLHKGPRPTTPDDGCPTWDSTGVATALSEAVTGHEWDAVVVAHHPLESHGEHGGSFPWIDHIFPLRHFKSWLWLPVPVVGSIYPIARRNGVSRQDQSNKLYRRYRATVEAASGTGVLAYAAGHDHTIQILDQPPFAVEIVSGTGYFNHISHLGGGDDIRYATATSGFVRLDRLADRRVRLAVIEVTAAGTRETHSEWLEPPTGTP